MEKLLLLAAVLPFAFGVAAGAEPDRDGDVVFTFTDPEIIESSGLVARDGLFATVNDSGDGARIFTVDPTTGDTVGTTTWDADVSDLEAMAPTPDGDVLVGDIGDNAGQRDVLTLTEVPMGRGRLSGGTAYELTFPDGPHDAEALLVHPSTGQVLVVAKEFIGRLYTAPEELSAEGPNELRQVGEVLPIATDGAFFPDGDHFILRDYGAATVYEWPSLEKVGELELPHQRQGEAIAVDEEGDVFVSSEGQFTEVLRIPLPPRLQAEVDGAGEPDQTTAPGGEAPADSGDRAGAQTATDDVEDSTDYWPWLLGGVVGLVIIGVLVRSLRPR